MIRAAIIGDLNKLVIRAVRSSYAKFTDDQLRLCRALTKH
jgi:hypothetical protein